MTQTLAFAFDSTTLAVIAVVGVIILGVAYFGLRFWLVSTRPADIAEIKTPGLDRINRAALEDLGDDEEEDDDDAPAALKTETPPKRT